MKDEFESSTNAATLKVRFMRLVTFVGVCDEVDDGVYAANERTKLINTPGLEGAEKHQFVRPAINSLPS